MTQRPKAGGKKRPSGCWIALLAVLIPVVLAAILIGQPIWKAKRIEQALNDRFGEAVAFVPLPDGSIPPERVEAFLRVRERVSLHCPEFQESIADLHHVGDPREDRDVPRADAAREDIGGLEKLLGLGPAFLRFMDTRNRALLEEEMGLGEYAYIYVLAYIEQLGHVADTRFAGVEQARVGSRARTELIQVLRNQLDALSSAESRPASADLAVALRDQIARLSAGRQSLPWEDGLPPAIAASLQPYAEPLAELYCEGIAKIELMQKNKGLDVKN